MATMKELLPKGDYEVVTVGPPRNWEFAGNNGTVEMTTDSIQFKGFEQYWIDVNRARKSEPPKAGEILKGHVEQDEAGKYAPKLVKEKAAGGGWQGGGGSAKASPGAIQAQNVTTATAIVIGFYSLTGKKPKDFATFMAKVEAAAPSVGKMVDRLVAAQPAAAPAPAAATNSEAGESAAPATTAADLAAKDEKTRAQANAAPAPVEDISDEDLGDW